MNYPLKRFFFSLRTAWRIMTSRHKHWIFISLDTKEMVNAFTGARYEHHIRTAGLSEYLKYRILKDIAADVTDNEMVLLKADLTSQFTTHDEEKLPDSQPIKTPRQAL